jgi:hypothetical protein
MSKAKRLLSYGFIGLFLLTGLIACGQEAEQPPTPISTAFLPTSAPTELAPTLPSTEEVAQVAPTLAATPTPVIPPTLPAGNAAALNITSPTENSTILIGSTLTVSGLSRVAADQSLQVRLVSVNGLLLAQTMAQVQDNTFQAEVTVPITITGAAQVQAQVLDNAGTVLIADALPVTIGVDAAANPRYLELYRPLQQSKAVGGYYLFFDGYAAQPTGTVFIAVYVDNCQTEAAATSFRVSSSSYWQGYLYIPNNLSGAGCAVARFGSPGADNWREAQVPIQLQRPNEEGAYAVNLFSPAHLSELVGGSNVTFWGTAYNAADNLVVISLIREDGVNLAQGSATVDDLGYWETSLNIPLSYTGLAQALVTIGNQEVGGIAQAVITVTILPAPTPTPEPAN